MGKIKAIFADYDGTLLRSDDTVSDHTLNVIHEFMRRGGKFFLNTGRVGTSAIEAAKRYGLSEYVACCQGGVVYDIRSEQVVIENSFSPELAREIMAWLEADNTYYQIYPLTGGYCTERFTPYTDFYQKACGKPAVILGQRVSKVVEEQDMRLIKILAVMEDEDVEAFRMKAIARFGDRIKMGTSRKQPTFFEFNMPGSTKGYAMLKIAEMCGLSAEQCVSFGDQENDMSMIQAAGTGVAVANAVPALKAVADYVTLSNDEDGVAAYIEKFCLGD